jgi:hypothetical protein
VTELDLVIPDFLPLLIKGPGKDPRDGGCLMQFVGYLYNGDWNDRPECTHPMLASVAIFANDNCSDACRSGLALFAPDLIGTNCEDRHLNSGMWSWAYRTRSVARDAAWSQIEDESLRDKELVGYLVRTLNEFRRLCRKYELPIPAPAIEPDTWVGAVSLMGAAS